MYVQGMSTSMPIDVQMEFLRTIPGLENVRIMRPGYAIEYDCINPLQLKPSLEFKKMAVSSQLGRQMVHLDMKKQLHKVLLLVSMPL